MQVRNYCVRMLEASRGKRIVCDAVAVLIYFLRKLHGAGDFLELNLSTGRVILRTAW